MKPDKIKNLLGSILEKMGISHDSIDESDSTEDMVKINITTKESGILIGSKGDTISALNHVVKKIASKGDEKARVSIDVNGYLEQSTQVLRNKVFILTERAKSFKTDVEMEPMSPYERMMVHSFLAADPHIETKSEGVGKNRRVVIKYKE